MTEKSWGELTKRDFKSLYRLNTCQEIATIFGKSDEIVRRRLVALGIERRKVGSRREFIVSEDKLKSLYQNNSMKQIARIHGVGETVVWKRLKEYGIKLHGYEDGGHRKKPGRQFSESHRKNLSNALMALDRRGERSVHWKGGKTAGDLAQRKSADATKWRRTVFIRANHKCEECGKKQGERCSCCGMKFHLYAHHIKPWASHPELRFDPDNGIALCSVCHDKSHGRITE